MESKEIISLIHQIFADFKIIKNLQEHMLRAAAVGKIICDHWDGSAINKEDIIAVLLIHDLGNIVKMDFNDETGLKLIGDEIKRIDYWKKIKQETIKKYGSDDHIVSEIIAEELGINERLRFILKNKVFNNNENTAKSNDWEIKIAAYADQRIGPFGVLSLEERFRDLKQRYYQKENNNVNNPKIDIFIKCAFEIEKQILSNTNLKPEDIDDRSIKKYLDSF
jgi:hypothetical protein